MVLTKKDFIKRAKLIKSFRSSHIRNKLTLASVKEFKASNPKFDVEKFKQFIKKKWKGGKNNGST